MRRLGQGDIAVFGCLNDLVIPEILNYFGRQMGQVKGSALRIRGAEDRTFGSSPRTSVEEFENDQFLAMKTEKQRGSPGGFPFASSRRSRRVPDRRGVGSILNRLRNVVRTFYVEKRRIISGPAGGRDL